MKTKKLPKARENARVKVAIGFSFESDWLKVTQVSEPITKQGKVKLKRSCTTLDTQLKFAEHSYHLFSGQQRASLQRKYSESFS